MSLNNIRSVSLPSFGKLPLAENPGTFTPSGARRNHKPGRLPEDGGFSTTSQPATLALNLNLRAGMDLAALNDISNEDITVRLEDGQVYMLSQAFVTEPVSFGDGESSITFVANSSERIA